ncbi:amino acid--tRNA ligase-related protein [Dactylosporangium sp. NPDC051484]|uniref:amino acid--tRNA ligase-related protein n=1 Tax=Dactylosporangium sp. NPDC051484 TaxID=3154942 RepID=UPI00344C76B1
MSYRVLSGELARHTGATIRLCGWVHRRRVLAKVTFLIVRDRAGLAQVVVPPGVPVPGEESVVEVTGRVVANDVAPGGFEVVYESIEVRSEAEPPPVERLHRLADYLAALGPQAERLEGYLAAFRHGMPPHGGFAIGLERFLARLTGAANVRETTLFPRGLHRLTP